MSKPFPILIMMPPHGSSPSEKWVSLGIQAAGLDLIHRLGRLKVEHVIYILAAEHQDQIAMEQHGGILLQNTRKPFHFGKALVDFIDQYDVERMAYFGAGSAPLAPVDIFEEAIDRVVRADEPLAVVNNLHSTDWAIFNNAAALDSIAERLPSDNQIGWVLQNEFGFIVEDLPVSAATRADIDTPPDLLMMVHHPQLGAYLRDYLSKDAHIDLDRITTVQTILSTPASHLTLIGRTSSHIWREIEKKTQIWTRLFVEERGMVASGRMARGEVQSLVAEILDQWGPVAFVSYLASISDAVLWDTRVWMAHQGGWPTKADRFAADLGRVEEISHPNLKELTQAVYQASIPIITGGHGVVAGGLVALLETIAPE